METRLKLQSQNTATRGRDIKICKLKDITERINIIYIFFTYTNAGKNE